MSEAGDDTGCTACPAGLDPGGGDRVRLHPAAAAARQPLFDPNFLSPEYLLQQLKVASFLGVIATGMMMVILLGQIDLSVPWTSPSAA